MRKMVISGLVLAVFVSCTLAAPRRAASPVVYGESYRETLAHIRACEESLATPKVVESLGLTGTRSGGGVEAAALAALNDSPRVIAITYHPFEVRLLTKRTNGAPRIRSWKVSTPTTIDGETSEKRQERLGAALARTLKRALRAS